MPSVSFFKMVILKEFHKFGARSVQRKRKLTTFSLLVFTRYLIKMSLLFSRKFHLPPTMKTCGTGARLDI